METILSKEFEDWTPVEKRLYRGPEELAAKLVAAEANFSTMVQDRSVLIRDLSAQKENALARERAMREKMQLFEENVPEVMNFDQFVAIPGIPFRAVPGNALLTSNVFKKTIDRDDVFRKILRFLVERESLFNTNAAKLQEGKGKRKTSEKDIKSKFSMFIFMRTEIDVRQVSSFSIDPF